MSSNTSNCIVNSQLLNTSVAQITPVCVPDYNIHLDTSTCPSTTATNIYIDVLTETATCGSKLNIYFSWMQLHNKL